MMHLIFTNHSHQVFEKENQKSSRFYEYITNNCRQLEIDLLAEEFNMEAVEAAFQSKSVCQIIATNLDISHQFCEPSTAERILIGVENFKDIKNRMGFGRVMTLQQDNQLTIEHKKYFRKREEFWVDKIQSQNYKNCLFVCGSDHLPSFVETLSDHEIKYNIICSRWHNKIL